MGKVKNNKPRANYGFGLELSYSKGDSLSTRASLKDVFPSRKSIKTGNTCFSRHPFAKELLPESEQNFALEFIVY